MHPLLNFRTVDVFSFSFCGWHIYLDLGWCSGKFARCSTESIAAHIHNHLILLQLPSYIIHLNYHINWYQLYIIYLYSTSMPTFQPDSSSQFVPPTFSHVFFFSILREECRRRRGLCSWHWRYHLSLEGDSNKTQRSWEFLAMLKIIRKSPKW